MVGRLVVPVEDDISLEISDQIVSYAPDSLKRLAVQSAPILEYFRARGNRYAARIVDALPRDGDLLCPRGVDAVLLRAHLELQRLHEEFLHASRVLELLRPTVAALRALGVPPPYRVVDVGCSLGYTIRWLTGRSGFGSEVEFIGVDYNRTLVECAQHAADREGLRCQFLVANAFDLADPATIFLSSGVLHHFRGEQLAQFLSQQRRTNAFLHFDIIPTWLTRPGAWLFHRARMRVPLARHDGVLSARRAHPGAALLEAARAGAPTHVSTLHDGQIGTLPVSHIFHCLVGLQPALREPFVAAIGRGRRRLGAWS